MGPGGKRQGGDLLFVRPQCGSVAGAGHEKGRVHGEPACCLVIPETRGVVWGPGGCSLLGDPNVSKGWWPLSAGRAGRTRCMPWVDGVQRACTSGSGT